MIEESSKAIIDDLSFEELEAEKNKGRYSRFSGANFAYVTERLAKLRREAQESDIAKTHKLAEYANILNSKSVATGKLTYRMTVIGVVVALLGFVLAQWFKS